jgi:hypothetical protein
LGANLIVVDLLVVMDGCDKVAPNHALSLLQMLPQKLHHRSKTLKMILGPFLFGYLENQWEKKNRN